jgi:threonine aldolase
VGSRATIERARRFRKMFGGGMRQVGIIAAGALFALRHHRARLAEDHANAKALASGLTSIRGLEADVAEVETNMVRFRVLNMPAPELAQRLQTRGVWVLAVGRDTIRAVTSLMVSAEDICVAIARVGEVLARDGAVSPRVEFDSQT